MRGELGGESLALGFGGFGEGGEEVGDGDVVGLFGAVVGEEFPVGEIFGEDGVEGGIDGGGDEVEKTLEIGMTGSHPTLIAHDVFSDEGQELPLLAGRAAGEGRRGWVSLGPNGLQTGKGCADGLGDRFKRGLRFERGLGHDGFVLDRDVQLFGGVMQQQPHRGNCLAELAAAVRSLWVMRHRLGLL